MVSDKNSKVNWCSCAKMLSNPLRNLFFKYQRAESYELQNCLSWRHILKWHDKKKNEQFATTSRMKEEKEEVGAGGNGRPTTQAAWWAGVSLGGEGRGGGGSSVGVSDSWLRWAVKLCARVPWARAFGFKTDPSLSVRVWLSGPTLKPQKLPERLHATTNADSQTPPPPLSLHKHTTF